MSQYFEYLCSTSTAQYTKQNVPVELVAVDEPVPGVFVSHEPRLHYANLNKLNIIIAIGGGGGRVWYGMAILK